VREAANEAFEQLVLRVRRNLAPHLKYVMGPWLVAQCDIYAPAASAAKKAFNSAFSPEKQSDAVGFCKLEVLAVCSFMASYIYVLKNIYRKSLIGAYSNR